MIELFSAGVVMARRVVAGLSIAGLSIAGLFVIGLSLSPGFVPEAVAQSGGSESAATDRQRAGELFKEGAEYYYAGDFPKALVKFKAAYALSPNALIMYNISLAHARLDNLEDALEAALAAKRGELPAKARTRNDARIHALRRTFTAREWAEEAGERSKRAARAEAKAASEKAKAARKAKEADAAREAEAIREAKTAKRAQAASEKPPGSIEAPVEPMSPPPEESFGMVGWSGVGLALTGAGALALSAYVDSSLDSDLEAYRQAAADGDENRYRSLQSDISSKQTLGKALLFTGAGLAALGGGIIVYELLDSPEGEGAAVTLDAALAPGSAALNLGVAY